MSLNNVNADCLLNIVKNLNLFELNSLGATNKYLLSIVIRELRRRFATKQVYFAGMHDVDSKIEENGKQIIVDGDTSIVEIIKEFGDSIQNLKIRVNHSASPTKVQEMYKLIEERCSDTLKKFHFGYLSYAFFPNISKPFKNVEFVKLDNDANNLDNNQYSFSGIFPVLRHFELGEEFTASNIDKVDLEFPFLEYFSVVICHYNVELEILIKSIIRKNPQIKGITLGLFYSRIIEFIQDELPRLKSLEFIDPVGDDLSNQIHFEHVERFTFKTSFPVKIKINFNNELLFFETSVNQFDNSFLDVIKQNQQLQELKLVLQSGITKFAMQELTSANLIIKKMAIINNQAIEAQPTIQLIESCKQLTDFYCSFATKFDYAYTFIDEFKKHFENEWVISVISNTDKTYRLIEVFSSKK